MSDEQDDLETVREEWPMHGTIPGRAVFSQTMRDRGVRVDGYQDSHYLDRAAPADDAPVIYADSFRLHISPSTITLDCKRQEPWSVDGSDRVLAHVQFNPLQLPIIIETFQRVQAAFAAEVERAQQEEDADGFGDDAEDTDHATN